MRVALTAVLALGAGLLLGLAVDRAPSGKAHELRLRVGELERTIEEQRLVAARLAEAHEVALERGELERLRLLGELEVALEERVARDYRTLDEELHGKADSRVVAGKADRAYCEMVLSR